MTDKAPTFIPPDQIYTEALESAVHAYERTKNIHASAEATADTIRERFGFPSVFAILAHKMTSNWWKLKLTDTVTVEQILTNVLTGLIAHDLAASHGLDLGDLDKLNVQQGTTQDCSKGIQGDEEKEGKQLAKPQMKRLPKPKPMT